MTICQINALRAARNAGLYVPKETVDACIEYVKQSQNPDGGFRYMLSGRRQRLPAVGGRGGGACRAPASTTPRRSATASPTSGSTPARSSSGSRYSHYFYGHYYAAQAMWIRGGDDWNEWYPGDPQRADPAPVGRRLLDRQHLQRVRHGHGPDHPPDPEQLLADLPTLSGTSSPGGQVSDGRRSIAIVDGSRGRAAARSSLARWPSCARRRWRAGPGRRSRTREPARLRREPARRRARRARPR